MSKAAFDEIAEGLNEEIARGGDRRSVKAVRARFLAEMPRLRANVRAAVLAEMGEKAAAE